MKNIDLIKLLQEYPNDVEVGIYHDQAEDCGTAWSVHMEYVEGRRSYCKADHPFDLDENLTKLLVIKGGC